MKKSIKIVLCALIAIALVVGIVFVSNFFYVPDKKVLNGEKIVQTVESVEQFEKNKAEMEKQIKALADEKGWEYSSGNSCFADVDEKLYYSCNLNKTNLKRPDSQDDLIRIIVMYLEESKNEVYQIELETTKESDALKDEFMEFFNIVSFVQFDSKSFKKVDSKIGRTLQLGKERYIRNSYSFEVNFDIPENMFLMENEIFTAKKDKIKIGSEEIVSREYTGITKNGVQQTEWTDKCKNFNV
ncbi:MAG: hypothetical protein K5917_01300 [Clostridiales bacterium]|nr:hypothetical protein [Clostridiales bacterium]